MILKRNWVYTMINSFILPDETLKFYIISNGIGVTRPFRLRLRGKNRTFFYNTIVMVRSFKGLAYTHVPCIQYIGL